MWWDCGQGRQVQGWRPVLSHTIRSHRSRVVMLCHKIEKGARCATILRVNFSPNALSISRITETFFVCHLLRCSTNSSWGPNLPREPTPTSIDIVSFPLSPRCDSLGP